MRFPRSATGNSWSAAVPELRVASWWQAIYDLLLAIANLRIRSAQIKKSPEAAAWARGASLARSLFKSFFPFCQLVLLTTLMLTFTFVFDEFVIAYFPAKFSITKPLKAWASLITGYDPALNAIVTFLSYCSLLPDFLPQLPFLRERTR